MSEVESEGESIGIASYNHKSATLDNDDFIALVDSLHRKNYQTKQILKYLQRHGYNIGKRTLERRLRSLGLWKSGRSTILIPELEKRQLVVEQLDNDPVAAKGPRTVKELIAREKGIHLSRRYITGEMKLHEPEGFDHRSPRSRKIARGKLTSLGPHHEWCGDGHEKLIHVGPGFPIWGLCDKWSSYWLLLRVVPDSRLKDTIAYLYLSAVYKLGGMPVQSTTDQEVTVRVTGYMQL